MKVLLNEDELKHGVAELARQINASYQREPLTIIGIMTGSIMLLADVVRQLEMPLRVGVIQTSSYREGMNRGTLQINSTMMPDIRNRDVLLIDDIFDTGHTLTEVIAKIKELGAKTIRSAVLLSKSGRCEVEMKPDFVMFDIPDEFVIGYGLDYRDEYRNLPFVGVLEPSDLENNSLDGDNQVDQEFDVGNTT